MTEASFETIKARFSKEISKNVLQNGQLILWIQTHDLRAILSSLKNDFGFTMLLDIVPIDWQGKQSPRFELAYLLYNLQNKTRITLKMPVSEDLPFVTTIEDLYPIANWLERECFDMMGITFKGHPNLKRLLMWNTFIGHPLRKDYPLNHRQPIPIQEDIV